MLQFLFNNPFGWLKKNNIIQNLNNEQKLAFAIPNVIPTTVFSSTLIESKLTNTSESVSDAPLPSKPLRYQNGVITPNTVADLFRHIQNLPNNLTFLNYKVDGQWKAISTFEFVDHVKNLALGLIALGINPKDNVALFAESSAWWLIADFTIILSGGVTVPIFAKISEENLSFQLKQTEPKYLFISGDEQNDMVAHLKYPSQKLIHLNDSHSSENSSQLTYKKVLQMGMEYGIKNPNAFEALLHRYKPDDLASIIYTSGTSGIAKGVMLTQKTLVTIIPIQLFEPFTYKESYFSILPLPHIFARNVIYYTIARGMSNYFSSDIRKFSEECQEIKPTFLILVPKVLEKVYAQILVQLDKSSFLKKWVAKVGIKVAQMKDSWIKKCLLIPFDKILYKKIRAIFGGRIRNIINGGAHLSNSLNVFFNAAGIHVVEGWGLTEGGCITMNTQWDHRLGSIGKPFGETKLAIENNGEIVIKGPSVTTGYYKNIEETIKVLDPNGWFHTGDKGMVDDDGFVYIIGRIKEMIKTSCGEYVVPNLIENELTKWSFIESAVIIGDNRPYVTTLLFVNPTEVKHLIEMEKLDDFTVQEYLEMPHVQNKVTEHINTINLNLNKWEKIVHYRIVPYHLSIETGELTPTLKLRRNVILDKFQEIIESMYIHKID